MIQVCKFNKESDLGVVIHGLSPDINAMIESGVVPDNCADVVYNQISAIEEVGCRVSDTFDAIILQRSFLAQSKSYKGDDGNDVDCKISVR